MPITLAQLAAFHAVAQEGSVTAAAGALAVSQPSVSGAVAGLGRELGCELLERSGRGVRLSPAGAAFAPYAEDVLGLLSAGREAAGAAAGLAARRLRVLALPTAAESFVPGLIAAFRAAEPAIEVSLEVAPGRELLARLGDHGADIGVCDGSPADPRLLATALFEDALVCLAAPDDPLAGGAALDAVELAGRPWLLREPGSGTRSATERYLAAAGLAPPTMTLGSNAAVLGAAAAGLGIALLPRAIAQTAVEAGRVSELRLRDRPPPRTWFAVRSRVGPPRGAIDAFLAVAARGLGGAGWR